MIDFCTSHRLHRHDNKVIRRQQYMKCVKWIMPCHAMLELSLI